ncbi:hypothetical protein BKA93DRAFT_752221 [Sparassis latifolia]
MSNVEDKERSSRICSGGPIYVPWHNPVTGSVHVRQLRVVERTGGGAGAAACQRLTMKNEALAFEVFVQSPRKVKGSESGVGEAVGPMPGVRSIPEKGEGVREWSGRGCGADARRWSSTTNEAPAFEARASNLLPGTRTCQARPGACSIPEGGGEVQEWSGGGWVANMRRTSRTKNEAPAFEAGGSFAFPGMSFCGASGASSQDLKCERLEEERRVGGEEERMENVEDPKSRGHVDLAVTFPAYETLSASERLTFRTAGNEGPINTISKLSHLNNICIITYYKKVESLLDVKNTTIMNSDHFMPRINGTILRLYAHLYPEGRKVKLTCMINAVSQNIAIVTAPDTTRMILNLEKDENLITCEE